MAKGELFPKEFEENSWQISVGVLALAFLVLAYFYYTDTKTYREEVVTLETSLGEAKGRIAGLEGYTTQLNEALENERERNDEAENILNEITGTVSDLQKLATLDPELLQKYSKVYFLNENYVPSGLREVEKKYLYDESEDEHVHSKVEPFLEDLLDEAEDDDISLWVVSAFRSFEEQSTLKSNYSVVYGSGANAFSADQGYSEHQLGTTVDFTTAGLNGGLRGFENTEAYEWLLDNAHRYGFTLSYPEGNRFYIFEPWHWRFIGTDLARDLHRDDAHFYDLPQREIDEYLLEIFD